MKRDKPRIRKKTKAGNASRVKAAVTRRNKLLFNKEFPKLLIQLDWWRGLAAKRLPVTQKQVNQVFNGILSYGLPFLKEVRSRQITNTHPIEFGFGILEFPIVFQSSRFGMEAHLRFGMKARKRAIFIETFMGLRGGSKANPSKLMGEIVGIAKATGYGVVYLRKPKSNPYYNEHVEVLTKMWGREMQKAGQDVQKLEKTGRPTSFDLRKIQQEHQQRMERLYYSVAKAFRFDKKTKGNYMKLLI